MSSSCKFLVIKGEAWYVTPAIFKPYPPFSIYPFIKLKLTMSSLSVGPLFRSDISEIIHTLAQKATWLMNNNNNNYN